MPKDCRMICKKKARDSKTKTTVFESEASQRITKFFESEAENYKFFESEASQRITTFFESEAENYKFFENETPQILRKQGWLRERVTTFTTLNHVTYFS